MVIGATLVGAAATASDRATGNAQSAAPKLENTGQNLQTNASDVKNLQLELEIRFQPLT